jgi:hypothetical protein
LEIEIIQVLVGVAELRLLVAALQQALAAAGEFIGDQAGEQVDGSHGIGLCLEQRVSSTSAMPLRRSWRRARSSSIMFIGWAPRIAFFAELSRDTGPVRG